MMHIHKTMLSLFMLIIFITTCCFSREISKDIKIIENSNYYSLIVQLNGIEHDFGDLWFDELSKALISENGKYLLLIYGSDIVSLMNIYDISSETLLFSAQTRGYNYHWEDNTINILRVLYVTDGASIIQNVVFKNGFIIENEQGLSTYHGEKKECPLFSEYEKNTNISEFLPIIFSYVDKVHDENDIKRYSNIVNKIKLSKVYSIYDVNESFTDVLFQYEDYLYFLDLNAQLLEVNLKDDFYKIFSALDNLIFVYSLTNYAYQNKWITENEKNQQIKLVSTMLGIDQSICINLYR